MGARYEGYNNADEIIAAFSDALDKSQPTCVGFVPDAGTLPDKVILVYRGITLDWSRFDLRGGDSDGVTIQLFKLPEGWRLVYITPFDFVADLPNIGSLEDCPSDQLRGSIQPLNQSDRECYIKLHGRDAWRARASPSPGRSSRHG